MGDIVAEKTSLERHIQTFIQIALTGVVGWMAMTTQETSVEVAKMSVQIGNLEEAVRALKDDAKLAYTGNEAQRDHDAIQRQIDGILARVDRLEAK